MTEREGAAEADDRVIDLTGGLELPEWITQAAARTPHDPTATIAIVAQGPAVALFDPGAAEPRWDPSAKPLPPLPDGGLAGAMPDWLREPPADAGALTTKGAIPAPDATLTDTSTFISETDLPHWIRQLAAVEAVQAAESLRSAADAAERVQDDAGDRLESSEATASRMRLPDSEESASVSRVWLARHPVSDSAGSVTEDRRAAFARVVEDVPGVAATSAAAAPNMVAGASPSTPRPRVGQRRRIVWAVILILIAIAVVIYLTSAGNSG